LTLEKAKAPAKMPKQTGSNSSESGQVLNSISAGNFFSDGIRKSRRSQKVKVAFPIETCLEKAMTLKSKVDLKLQLAERNWK